MGIAFAFLSLGCAVWNDLIFKIVRRQDSAHAGRFVAGVGVLWTLVFTLAFVIIGQKAHWQGWVYAVLSGIMSAVANLLLIDSLARVEVGVGSTIYRLNLIWVIVLSVLFLNESLTLAKLIAVFLGVTAIALLSASVGTLSFRTLLGTGLRWLLLASLLRALMGIFYKLALSAGMGLLELLMVSGACWVVVGMASAWSTREGTVPITWNKWVLLSGILVCGIVFFLSKALTCSQASVAVPISQFNFVGTAVLGIFLFNEPFTMRKGIGLASACGAILLLALG